MSRPKKHETHISSAVKDLLVAVASLVKSVHGAVTTSPDVRGATSKVGKAAGVVGHAAAVKGAKLKKSLKGYWARLTPAQHRARVAKMQAGRGVKKKRK